MRISFAGAAAATAVLLASSGVASAQLTKIEQKCVTALHKDGLKVASSYAKRTMACLSDAHDGAVADLGACVGADPDEITAKAIAKADADASKRCTTEWPAFGVPAAFDDTIVESVRVHGRGLFLDLLGNTPAAAGDDAGNDCQDAVVDQAQRLAAAYGKAFAKCTATALKAGAVDGDALLGCLAPDVDKDEVKLTDDINGSCVGVSPAAALPGVCSGETDATVAECVKTRTRCRACRQTATIAAIDADCDMLDDATDNDSCSFPVTLSGNAIHFSEFTRVEGAEIWVLEHPEMTYTTDADGYFEFPNLQEGEEVSLVLEHPDFHPIQNGTVRLGALGAERVTFQAVTWEIYQALADLLEIVPDEVNKCQMVTTVTRVGRSIYDPGAHGEAAVTVTLDPPLPSEHGPIYFNSDTLPVRGLVRTSDDGGVLYVQVPPGEYLWAGRKGTAVFTRVKTKCRAGLLVNASPPWGLQKH